MVKGTHSPEVVCNPDPRKLVELPAGEYLLRVAPDGSWKAVVVDQCAECPQFWKDFGSGVFLLLSLPLVLLAAPFAMFGAMVRKMKKGHCA